MTHFEAIKRARLSTDPALYSSRLEHKRRYTEREDFQWLVERVERLEKLADAQDELLAAFAVSQPHGVSQLRDMVDAARASLAELEVHEETTDLY